MIFIYKRTFSLKQFAGFVLVLLAILFTGRYLLQLNLKAIDTESLSKAVAYFENPLAETNSFLKVIELQFKAFFYYLKFQVYPKQYLFYYGYNMVPLNGMLNLKFIIGLISFLSIVMFLGYVFIKRQNSLLAYGFAIFLILTLPYLVFIFNIAGIFAVRYGFYASIGSAIVFAVLLQKIYHFNKYLGVCLTIAFLLTGSYFSEERCFDWKSQETLYAKDMPYLKDSYIANRMLGTYYFHQTNEMQNPLEMSDLMEESRRYFHTAYSMYQEDPVLLRLMGNGFLREQKADSALYYFLKMAEADPDNPETWKQMADFYLTINDIDKVVFYANKIMNLEKDNQDGLAYINTALTAEGRFDELINFNQKMIEENPQSYLPYLYLAKVYQAQNNRPLAMINYFESFLRGFEDDRLKRSLVQYAIGQNYKEIIQNYPMFFE